MAANEKELYSEGLLRIQTGEADIDVSEADYTNYQVLATIAPGAQHALEDLRVVFDLAKATTGFAAGHTSQTITFVIARKIDGTNWRRIKSTETTALSGTNSANGTSVCGAMDLLIGDVGPTEQVRIEVKLSAENSVDIELPFVATYKAGARATFTPVAAA